MGCVGHDDDGAAGTFFLQLRSAAMAWCGIARRRPVRSPLFAIFKRRACAATGQIESGPPGPANRRSSSKATKHALVGFETADIRIRNGFRSRTRCRQVRERVRRRPQHFDDWARGRPR